MRPANWCRAKFYLSLTKKLPHPRFWHGEVRLTDPLWTSTAAAFAGKRGANLRQEMTDRNLALTAIAEIADLDHALGHLVAAIDEGETGA